MPSYPRMAWGRNHKCEHPQRMIFVSVETVVDPATSQGDYTAHRLMMGVASKWKWKGNQWQKLESTRFRNAHQFWGFVYGYAVKKQPVWVYCHNASVTYTVLGLWTELDHERLKIVERENVVMSKSSGGGTKERLWKGKTAIDGVPFILETRCDGKPIKFLDVLNYYDTTLVKLAAMLKIKPPEIPDWEHGAIDWYSQCEQSVCVIEQTIVQLLNMWKYDNLGNWQPTVASLAYSAYRHGKESCEIVAHGDRSWEELNLDGQAMSALNNTLSPKEVSDVERRAYYGGRCSVFFLGDIIRSAVSGGRMSPTLYNSNRCTAEGPIYHLDVNSMYGYAMRNYSHPIELCDTIRHPGVEQANRLCQSFPCAADVELTSESKAHPKRRNSYTAYLTGRFTTTLCGLELLSAFESDSVRGVANLCVYYHGKPFNTFVDYWHTKRVNAKREGDDTTAKFCSLMMQSLYGKLAQLSPTWQTDGHTVPPVRWGTYLGQPSGRGDPQFMRAVAGISQYQSERRACRHTMTACAASITAAARHFLGELIASCPPKSVVYSDTDSLFCLRPAFDFLKGENMIDPDELGKLKIKGIHDRCTIWGQKDYELDGVRVIAGLRSDAEEVSERLFRQINYDGMKSVISSDPTGAVMSKMVQFAPLNALHDVTVNYDGWTTPQVIYQ